MTSQTVTWCKITSS